MPVPLHVVKVGGSLFSLPDLGARLRDLLATLGGRVLLFPGGGVTADAIRELDRIHALGEEASHWLALRALSINARFLIQLLPEARLAATRDALAPHTPTVLDPLPFAELDEETEDHCPHLWSVTSDSLALRAAQSFGADGLVLLKSVDLPPDMDWQAAADKGLLDEYFPQLLTGRSIPVRWVNLRKTGAPNPD